jgi:hypothetical protein
MNLLIIHPEGNIKNNPNLYAFTKELVKEGYSVVIFSLYREGIYQGELFQGARMEYYGLDRAENLKAKLKLIKQDFCHIIGIDQGVIEAARMAKVLKINYSFLSYEIFFDNELIKLNNATDLKHKRQSKKACQDIQFAIVQDDVRKSILAEEYLISNEKILLMPVAGTGIRPLEKTKYFHDKLHIPAEKKVLLYMGWMDELQINRMTGFATYMPDNWVIVVHSRYKYAGKLPENFKADKIYFSLDTPIENIDDMGILLSGADAGFCSYKASFDSPFTGDNITYIGMSSGKTTTFLQYGIPVVIENMNMWDEIVPKEKIGLVVRNQADLMGLDSLSQSDIIQNCLRFFEQEIDIKNFCPAIFKQISNSKMQSQINKSSLFWYICADNYLILKARIKKLFRYN